MEQDLKLWQQLTTLQDAIESLTNEFILTRCRTNTFTSGTEPDQGLREDDDSQKVRTKPRSHTITLAEEITVYPSYSLLFVERLNLSVTTEFRALREMRESGVSFNDSYRRSGFLGVFSPFRYKTGLFETNLSGLRNNLFLTGLNASFVDIVGDVIKPPSSQQILPRRRLHRQLKVFNPDHGDVETTEHITNDTNDDSSLKLESSNLEKVLLVQDNETNEVQVVKQQTTSADGTGEGSNSDSIFRSKAARENVNDSCCDNELEYASEDIVAEKKDRSEVYQTDLLQDNEDEQELADMTYNYLCVKDGYVTCRIMTPGLEQQIKLKHETEEEPLEYLRYSCSFVRFRSGSDSESSSWSDSEQSDIDNSSLDYFDNATIHSDVYSDIKYLFRIDREQEGSESDQSDIDGNHLDHTADEVLNDIRYLFGTDQYCLESGQGESLNYLAGIGSDLDIYCDIKNLFGTGSQQYCLENSDENVVEGCEVHISTLPSCSLDSQVMTSPAQRSSGNFQTNDLCVQRGTMNVEHTAERLDKQFVATEEILNQIVGGTSSLLSQEYVVDGCGLCVYTEKHCSFTYRISSVDSGIGDDINELLELSD